MRESRNDEDIIIKDEVKTNFSAISESATKEIFNSIVRIEFKSSFATGFFMKIESKNIYFHCLITNYHVINEKLVNEKEVLFVYYGEKDREKKITIILDTAEIFIKVFDKECDVAIIEILKNDKIQENKFLSYDLNYKSEKGYFYYLNKNIFLAGYPCSVIYQKERHVSGGKIIKIKNYKFNHILDTEKGSSGSPICLIENRLVIGIHKGGNKENSINMGIFIGHVIEELNKEEGNINNIKNINNINNSNFIVNIIEKNKYFFSLEEYNKEIYKFHHMISKYYIQQTESMFNLAYNDLNNYLLNTNIKLEKSREQIMNSLKGFKDLQINYQNIVRSDFINDINILMETNFELSMEKFGYFIAGFMKALDLFGKNKEANLIVESDLEKKKLKWIIMTYFNSKKISIK